MNRRCFGEKGEVREMPHLKSEMWATHRLAVRETKKTADSILNL